MPPQGEIDGSVLKAVGELFLWPALAFGAKALDDNRKIRIQKGNTTITVGSQGPEMPMHRMVEADEDDTIMEGETNDE